MIKDAGVTREACVKETVERVLAGDRQAFAEIVREYGPMIRVFLSSHLRDHHAVEDLSQEVFVAAFWALNSFDPSQSFRAWLSAIARNKLMSHLRSHYSQKNGVHVLTIDIHELLLPSIEQFNPDSASVIKQLRNCVAKHPEKDRLLIESRYFHDEPVLSIAERLCTTVSAVSSQLYRIRAQLRECIEGGVPL